MGLFRLIAISAVVCLAVCSAKEEPNTVPCTWEDPAGGKYDLSPLANPKADYNIPKNTFPLQGWEIWINICRPTVTSPCTSGSAACQQWDPTIEGGKASIGAAASTTFGPAPVKGEGGYGVQLMYGGGLEDRKTTIDFICSKSAGIGSPKFVGENPTHSYNFSWESEYACPPSGGGISPGSILLILLLCLVVVYLVAGILFNRFKRGLTGIEMIPQVEFWTSVPGLVKDGVMFLVNKVRGRGSYTQV